MPNRRLLVVDDEPAFGTFVRRVAEGQGVAVEITDNAGDFKAAYKQFGPTIIFLDLIMPGTDGIELIRWLQSQGCTAKLVIISGYDPTYGKMAETIGNAWGTMSIGRLKKPVMVADLKDVLAA